MNRRLAGLYAVTPDLADTAGLHRKVKAAIAGGAAAVQYRNKTADAALRHEQAERLQALCRSCAVPLIVNDDVELALAVRAAGVHIGQDDGAVRDVRRRIGTSMWLGVSCYDRLDLADAALRDGADYIAFGAAFPSRVKPVAVRASLALYAEARARYESPIVGIGGITLDNASSLIAAGVDAVAVISALFDAPDVERAAASFTALYSNSTV